MTAGGPHCFVWASSGCSEWGPLFVAEHGLLVTAASLIAEHGVRAHGPQWLQCAGSGVQAH